MKVKDKLQEEMYRLSEMSGAVGDLRIRRSLEEPFDGELEAYVAVENHINEAMDAISEAFAVLDKEVFDD